MVKLPGPSGGGLMGGFVVLFMLVLLAILIIAAIAVWQLVSWVQDLLGSCAVPTGGGTILMLAALEIAKVRVCRPTVLTSEVLSEIARLREAGHGYKFIARELGIGRTTVRRVLGKAGDG